MWAAVLVRVPLVSCALLGLSGRAHAQEKPLDLHEATLQAVLGIIRGFYVRELDLRALEADARARGVDSMVRSLDVESRIYSATDLQTRRRDTLRVPAARMLMDRIGYVAILELHENVGGELSDAIAGLKRRGLKGLVLDLRGSPGGLMSETVAVCRLFLGGGQVVFSTTGRSQSAERTWRADGKPAYAELPVTVIVDRHTAAGSEIIAGALQDHRRAIVVGSRTLGKGFIQSFFVLPDGSALKLTTAIWVTPAGRHVTRSPTDSGGIVPDVDVLLAADVETLTGVLRMKPQIDVGELMARDSTLRTAVGVLVRGRPRP
jgi:carboxyl-terminal processing protease